MRSEARCEAPAGLLELPAHNPSINAVRDAVRHADGIVDFCVPVNPYFPPDALLQRLTQRLPDLLRHYPDYAPVHERHIASFTGVPAANVVACNGSTEIITALCRTARGPITTTVPTFGRWTDLPAEWGTPLHTVAHRRERHWQIDVDELIEAVRRTRSTFLVLCNPNNPTGACIHYSDIVRLVRSLAHLDAIVIDESFIDFSTAGSARQLAVDEDNVIVVSSLGKSLGWHGIRLGYAVTNRGAAAELRAQLPFWNINGVAAYVLEELAERSDVRHAYRASFARVAADRRYLRRRLQEVPGLVVYRSHANFVYVELPSAVSGRWLRDQLLQRHGLFVRECSNKLGSCESFLRIAVTPTESTDRLVEALASVLSPLRRAANPQQ